MIQILNAFFIISLGAAAVQLVFLLRSKRHYVHKAVFSLFLINVILLIAGFLAMQAGAVAKIPFFTGMFMAITLCVGPLIYLYILSVFKMWRRVPAAQLLHFTPAVLILCAMSLFDGNHSVHIDLTKAIQGTSESPLYVAYRIFMAMSLFFYISKTAYMSYVHAYKRKPRYPADYWRGVSFSRHIVHTLAAVLFGVLAFDVLEYLLPELFPDNTATQLLSSSAILYIGFMGTRKKFSQTAVHLGTGKNTVENASQLAGRKKPYTLITGASTGLGRSVAGEFARMGKNLILVSLPGEGLKQLSGALSRQFGVDVMPFEADLSEKDAPLELASGILGRYSIDTVVNNAGVGGSRKIENTSIAYLDAVIQLNIRALSMLTRLFLEELKTHENARIINISSLAAFSPMPYKSVYPASKAFVYSFSRGLREELKGTSVSVIVANPGPILTNSDVLKRIEKQGFFAKLFALTPEQVTSHILEGIYTDKAVVIPGFANRINKFLLTWIPEQLRLPMLSRVWRTEAA